MTRFACTLLAASILAAAPTASAKPDKAEKTLEKILRKSAKSGASRVERRIKNEEVADFQALMTDTYGPPAANRSGVMVWDVPTPQRSAAQAATTTIMIGVDAKGRPIVIADDRLPDVGIARRETVRVAPADPSTPPATPAPIVDTIE